MQVIFTASPEFAQIALAEIQKLDRQSKFLQWLDQGIGLIELGEVTFSDLAPQIAVTRSAFVRHLCPVLETVPLEKLQTTLSSLIPVIDRTQSLSIQIRAISKEVNRSELRNEFANDLIAAGLNVVVKDPVQIVSIFCSSNIAYIGFSTAAENLSSWTGGMHRFAHEAGQISRAEFKLLEAIAVFNLTLPTQGRALDLGASPGGWTRVLRQIGLSVVAVDPGDLADALHSDPKVSHSRQLVQQYVPNCRDRFDLIVNDMRMDAADSAKNMRAASQVLKPGGLAIMTLKLPGKGVKAIINTAIAILENSYEIIGVRNLFHNRQEVTVVMRSLAE
ncbi:MAG: methyltransferase domain-containing protein [Leptolyngbya sp. Prado105]|jgi:23S rRNA (cytidine2498-2'-O)-methyltransferase|nr:methyltransferase domain-containing protein [Leptolyngbya sp. Prado105]